MQRYKDFSPSFCDVKGLGLDDRQEWFVINVTRTRDSGCLDESNFACALQILGGESETVEVSRFGHWGPGWFEIILVAPESPAQKEAESIEAALADYPVLNDTDFSNRETEAANDVWRDCYRTKDRIAYIRENRNQFEFRGFADLLGCARGNYFSGYASELLTD